MVDTRLASFESITVVEVKNDLRMFPTKFFCIFYSAFCHVTEQCTVCILTCTFRNLKDNRRFCFGSSLYDSLKLFHIVEVECRDCITSFDCLCKHLASVYKTKIFITYHSYSY